MPSSDRSERTRERMASVDTAWLRMDQPANLMQIIGVMVFAGRLDPERFKRTVLARLSRYPRFRQIAELDADGAWWIDDDDFDIDAHVRQSLLPAPRGTRELQKFVAELASEPLNPARPRWEYHLVEKANGDSAVVVRIHHAIADGIALVGVLHSLTDEFPDAPEQGSPQPAPETAARLLAERDGEADDVFWKTIAEPLTDLALASIRISGSIWGHYQGLRKDPSAILDYASVAKAVASEIGKLALMPNDSETSLKGKPGTIKRVSWSEPMPLPQVKAVGRALGCSINDMLLSAVAGALRAYLKERGDAALSSDTEVRALVPVNLRDVDNRECLGNHFGLVALELPVGIENPLARLYATRKRMEALKSSYQAPVTYGVLGLVGMVPKFVQKQILDLLSGKASAVMTNVPGPQHARYLAGKRLKQQMFWVPQSGNIGMGVSILSYDGQVQFGLITDKNVVDDPERIVDKFSVEFEKLLWLVLMEPWSRLADPDAVESALLE